MKITIELTDEQVKEIVSQALLANLGGIDVPKKSKKPANRVTERPKGTGEPTNADIREWARNEGAEKLAQEGIELNTKGLIKDSIKALYFSSQT